MEDEVSDDSERKIEQDVVFRLLHNFGPPDEDQSTLSHAREEDDDPPHNGTRPEWYTLGGHIFMGSAVSARPSLLPLLAAAVAVLMGALVV